MAVPEARRGAFMTQRACPGPRAALGDGRSWTPTIEPIGEPTADRIVSHGPTASDSDLIRAAQSSSAETDGVTWSLGQRGQNDRATTNSSQMARPEPVR